MMVVPNPELEAALARLSPEQRARLSRAIAGAIADELNRLAAEGDRRMHETMSVQTPDSLAIQRKAYRVKEIAAMSGLAEQTIYEKVYKGELPRLKAGGRAVLVPAAAVEEWLRAGSPDARRQ